MVPNLSCANAETVDRLTEQLAWFMKAFHAEQRNSGVSREAEFRARELCRDEAGRIRHLWKA